jgi:hypothetical protein
MGVADTIECVDCGGTCHRMPLEPPELGWQVGDVVAYRCGDCADMWYLEVDAEDLDTDDPDPGWP